MNLKRQLEKEINEMISNNDDGLSKLEYDELYWYFIRTVGLVWYHKDIRELGPIRKKKMKKLFGPMHK